MASDDASAPRAPVVLRIKLRYDDLDTMVQRFAPNVGRSGLFLPTKSMQPAGTEIKFELRLANDTPVLVGVGRVKHAQAFDPARPKASFGLAIELMRVTRESREVIIRMIERRRVLGLADVAIPMPEDAEAARRGEVESSPRAETSGIVREAMAQFASAPVSEQVLKPRAGSGPIAAARQDSRPMVAIAPLQPEPVKPKRPRVHEVIARANETSGPVAALPELDDAQIDLAKVISRARVLAQATGADDLDAQLAALRESAAAPVEISVEAASAELARQLGGAGVSRRDRSARWEPPPAVVAKSEPVAAPAAEPEPVRGEPEIVAPEPAATDVEAHERFAPAEEIRTEPGAYDPPASPMIDDDADLDAFERALDAAIVHTGHSRPAPPRDQPEPEDDEPLELNDRVEQLDSMDLEPADDGADGERTQIGAVMVEPGAFAAQELMADAGDSGQLADRLDEQLAAAEAEADADFAIAMQPAPEGYDPYAAGVPEPVPGAYGEPPAGAFDDDEPSEEIDDLDVLAVADADDADLLDSEGEREVSGSAAVAPEPSYSFVQRLALDDEQPPEHLPPEHLPPEHLDEDPLYAEAPRYPQPVQRAATYDPPSGGYTIAQDYPDEPEEFDEPHAFAQMRRPVTQPPPNVPRAQSPVRDYDLESALEGLDPDVDLAPPKVNPHTGSRPVRLPGLPEPRTPRRPTEDDDGVLIDFDDDD
ncbi:MAG: hypothetical protein ACM31C_26720 [Acidobacteriota bacterium]